MRIWVCSFMPLILSFVCRKKDLFSSVTPASPEDESDAIYTDSASLPQRFGNLGWLSSRLLS